ncbi:MAG: NBR1-Ig-like domain-containing protein [Caldilineaceae bacterium]
MKMRLGLLLVLFCLAISTVQSVQAQTCTPSDCTPDKVIVSRGLKQNSTSGITGCIVYIDAFEDDVLGGNVRTVSLIQPLRDIPYIGAVINKVPIIKAEKWAATINATVNGEKTWLDVAWMLFVDVTVEQLGATTDKGMLNFLGYRLTQAEAVNHWVIGPILKQIAEKLPKNASDWVTFYRTSQAWSYTNLQHCVDTGQLNCYGNYDKFLQAYPETYKFLGKAQILSCQLTDNAQYVKDVTIPDGTLLPASKVFHKTWRLRNNGQTTWGTGYQLVFVEGERLSGQKANLTGQVAPGKEVDIGVDLTAPAKGGAYRGNWQLQNAQGQRFGPVVFVEISVPSLPTPTPKATQPAPGNAVDGLELFANVTIPDGTLFPPGKAFRKRWQVKNSGQTTWGTGYKLTLVRGDRLNAGDLTLPVKVAPGDIIELGLNMQAPMAGGVYKGDWRMQNAQGNAFGAELHVEIEVPKLSAPVISFNAERTTLNAGECTNLSWKVENAVAVHLGGIAVNRQASQQVCPAATQAYTLRVFDLNGGETERTLTLQVNPAAVAQIDFRADRTSLNSGECTSLHWDVEHVREIYLDGHGVTGHGSLQVCPASTQTFRLKVVRQDGGSEDRRVTIQVNMPVQTPVPAGTVCGQFIRINQSLDKWPAFQPAGANEVWIIDPVEMDYLSDIFQEGVYAQLENPAFGNDGAPAWGYTRVRYLLDDDGATRVASCGATHNPPPTPAGQAPDLGQLRDEVLSRLGSAALSTQYPQQAQQLVNTLFAHWGDFGQNGGQISQSAMQQALQRSDVGMRLNATVQGVWGSWVERGQQANFDPNTTDPGAFADVSPFRRLIIRLVQGSQGPLGSAEQHALHNLLTRSEDQQTWRDNMNGIVGAINRESFH